MKLWAGGRTLTWAKTKTGVMILAPAEERPSLPLPFSLSPFCLLCSLVLSRFLPFLVFFLPCLSAFFGPLCELPPVIAPCVCSLFFVRSSPCVYLLLAMGTSTGCCSRLKIRCWTLLLLFMMVAC
jgi:hypothetical protein